MEITGETPGPRIGWILNAILEEILEKPELNEEKILEEMAIDKAKLNNETLKDIGESGKEKKEIEEEKAIKKIRNSHKVS